ncbi:MAG: DNRLRE domain-containing protein, partial [Bacilli bacterium]
MKRIFALTMSFCLFITAVPITSVLAMEKISPETTLPINPDELSDYEVLQQQLQPAEDGEVVTYRTETSKTYLNEDGTLTTNYYSEPVHYETKEKEWEPIAPLLVKEGASTFALQETAWSPVYVQMFQKGKPYATISKDDASIAFELQSATDGTTVVTPNEVKATHTNEDIQELLYPGIFPSMDLRAIFHDTSVKEDFILQRYEGLHTFTFYLQTKLHATKDGKGGIVFTESKDDETPIFTLPRPIMIDSNYDEDSGEYASSDALTYTIEPTKGGYTLTLTADEAWLTDEDREYPVHIDPSTSITMTLDTFVMSKYPTTNYNSSSQKWDESLKQYVVKVGEYDSTTGMNFSFMKHPIGSLQGMEVTDAKLKAYVAHSYSSTPTGLWLDQVTSDWQASSVTWNTKPTSKNLTSVSVAKGNWATFPVTDLVKKWVEKDPNTPNYGFKFHTNGNKQTHWKKLVSATNSTNKPHVAVTYRIPQLDAPVAKAYNIGTTKGYVDLTWKPMPGATSYNVWVFNGKEYEKFPAGNTTSWSTKGKGIWPRAASIASGRFALHTDSLGDELSIDPSPVYKNSEGKYPNTQHYWFRVTANFSQCESAMSEAATPYIPVGNIVANEPIVTTTNIDPTTGSIELKWKGMMGATGYRIWIFNGKDYESFDVGGQERGWSSKDKNIWPTNEEIANGRYLLHKDGEGTELAVDPSPVYKNSGGKYPNHTNYWVRMSALYPQGESKLTAKQTPEISTKPIEIIPELGVENYGFYKHFDLDKGNAKVNIFNHNVIAQNTDIQLFTRGVLGYSFSRTFNSNSDEVSALGKGWTYTGNQTLE